MFKGTPGPWIWAEKNQGLYGAGPDNAVLDFYSYEGMYLSGKTDEAQTANGLLISASPELLDELLKQRDDLVSMREFYSADKRYFVMGEMIDRIDAAIAKALGETK